MDQIVPVARSPALRELKPTFSMNLQGKVLKNGVILYTFLITVSHERIKSVLISAACASPLGGKSTFLPPLSLTYLPLWPVALVSTFLNFYPTPPGSFYRRLLSLLMLNLFFSQHPLLPSFALHLLHLAAGPLCSLRGPAGRSMKMIEGRHQRQNNDSETWPRILLAVPLTHAFLSAWPGRAKTAVALSPKPRFSSRDAASYQIKSSEATSCETWVRQLLTSCCTSHFLSR